MKRREFLMTSGVAVLAASTTACATKARAPLGKFDCLVSCNLAQ